MPLGMQAWDLWDLPGPEQAGSLASGSPDEMPGWHAFTLGGHLPKPQGLGSEANAPASCIWQMLSTQKETGFNAGYRPVIELIVRSWGVDRPSQGMYRHVSRGCHLVSTGGMGREGDLGSGLAHGSFVR